MPGAVLAALEAGNDPATDQGVRAAVIGREVNVTAHSTTTRLGERVAQFVTDHADDLLGIFTRPFDKAATTLSEAATRLGDVDLDDTKAVLARGWRRCSGVGRRPGRREDDRAASCRCGGSSPYSPPAWRWTRIQAADHRRHRRRGLPRPAAQRASASRCAPSSWPAADTDCHSPPRPRWPSRTSAVQAEAARRTTPGPDAFGTEYRRTRGSVSHEWRRAPAPPPGPPPGGRFVHRGTKSLSQTEGTGVGIPAWAGTAGARPLLAIRGRHGALGS